MPALSVSQQLAKILADYSEQVDDTFAFSAQKVAKETVQDLKQTSPRDKRNVKHYADGWATKKSGKLGYVVYNKTSWRLTHLLNNGHVIANANGTYGRTQGDNHIGKAEERANRKLIEEVSKQL